MFILLILVGAVAIRADLDMKKANAMKSLALITEQIKKSPSILARMESFDCGDRASESVEELKKAIDGLPDKPSVDELKALWNKAENTWVIVSAGCVAKMNQQALIDLSTEMEGVRNRISVEAGKYSKAVDIYNSSLSAFPSNLFAWGMRPLEKF